MAGSCKVTSRTGLVVAARLTVSAFVGVLAMACGTSPGGSGSFLVSCSAEAPCTAPLACINGFCQYPQADTAAADTVGPDVASGSDVVAGEDAGVDATGATDATTLVDTTSPSDIGQPTDVVTPADGAPQTDSAIKPDTGNPQDTASADTQTLPDTTAQADTTSQADASAGLDSIAAIQQSASSMVCGTPDGVSSHGNVALKSLVITGPLVVTGSGSKKIQTFHVRPASEPASASYAGLTVVVPGSTLTLQPGDVVDLSGEYQEFYCLTEVYVAAAADVKLVSQQTPPAPYDVAWTSLGPGNIEALEGVLIRVPAAKVVDPALPGSDGKPHGEALLLSSGGVTLAIGFGQGSSWVGADQSTLLQNGQSVQSVTGHLQFSFGKYLLRLRSDADFVP